MLKISCNEPKTVLKVNDGMIARVVVVYPCEVMTDGCPCPAGITRWSTPVSLPQGKIQIQSCQYSFCWMPTTFVPLSSQKVVGWNTAVSRGPSVSGFRAYSPLAKLLAKLTYGFQNVGRPFHVLVFPFCHFHSNSLLSPSVKVWNTN